MIDLEGLARSAIHAFEVVKSSLQSFEAAGTLGAILSLRWVPGNTWSARAFAFGGGLGMVFYVGPLLMKQMDVHSNEGLMAGGFLLGTLGANLIAKAVDYVKSVSFGDIVDLLVRIRGK